MKSGAPWEHTLDPAIVSRGRAPYRRYVCLFLSFIVVGYVASFFLVRSKGYPEWRGGQWGPMLDYSFTPGKQNADVLIFGDSSAFIGIDPRILEAELGVKALMLPNTVGSLPMTGDIPLKRYLATHTPPRLLVFYFSPWNLNYNDAKKVRFFEGEQMMLRHGTAGEIVGVVRRFPTEFLVFPFRFYNAYGFGILRSLFHHQQPVLSIDKSLGHMDDKEPFPTLTSACKFPAALLADDRETSVEELVRQYTSKVRVLVYVSPIPGCTNAAAVLGRSFSGLSAAPPAVLPPSEFVGDPYYAHIEPRYVPTASRLLAEAVEKQLAASNVQTVTR